MIAAKPNADLINSVDAGQPLHHGPGIGLVEPTWALTSIWYYPPRR